MTIADPARSLPRPPGPPPRRGTLRSIPYFVGFARDPIGFVRKRFETYGDIYYAPSQRDGGLYVMRHPDHLHAVLVTHAACR